MMAFSTAQSCRGWADTHEHGFEQTNLNEIWHVPTNLAEMPNLKFFKKYSNNQFMVET